VLHYRRSTKRLPLYSWVYVRQYCAEIDEAARNRMELIVRSLAEQNGVTEQLKAKNQMEWVRQMNACKAQAEEIVKAELIYD
jgi:metal-dependent amidase/aminoacylase/carboxypeptidase family protein